MHAAAAYSVAGTGPEVAGRAFPLHKLSRDGFVLGGGGGGCLQ